MAEAAPGDDAGDAAGRLLAAPRGRGQFDALYRDHFNFVFRNLCRLGVPRASVDDALQDVFLVVLRRLHEFRPDSSPRAWLFAIALRVASDHRRTLRRKGGHALLEEGAHAASDAGPFEEACRNEALGLVHAALLGLEEDRRAVFIMTELERLSAPEIAAALGANVNTVYTRIRAARRDFALQVERLRRPGESR